MKGKPLYKVPVGSRLILDGCTWTVVGKDRDGYAVESADDGEYLTLPYDRIDSAIRTRDCEVITPRAAEKQKKLLKFTGGYERVEQLPPEEQKDVRARTGLMLAMDKLKGEGERLTQRYLSRRDVRDKLRDSAIELSENSKLFHDVHIGSARDPHALPKGRTLKELHDRFHEFDRNPVVLMRRGHLKGPRGEQRRKLTDLQEQFIKYVLNLWLSVSKPKLAPLYNLAKTEFFVPAEEVARGFKFPSITTVRARLNAMSEVVKTVGREGLRNAANLKGAGSTDIRALMFGEKGETDQVYLSIFVDEKGAV